MKINILVISTLLATFLSACTEPTPMQYTIDFADTSGTFTKTLALDAKEVEGSLVTFAIPCADVFDFQLTMTQKKGRLWGAENTAQFSFRIPETQTCTDLKEFPVKLDLQDLAKRISEKYQISMPKDMIYGGHKIEFKK